MHSYTEVLADFVCDLDFSRLDSETLKAAKRCVMDHIACVVGGARTGIGEMVTKTCVGMMMVGKEAASILGTSIKTSTVNGAFANGFLANILDFDDFCAWDGHPGATAIPPALAVCEALGRSGRELIEAVVVGYEICIRLGRSLWPKDPEKVKVRGWGTYQTLSSAASSAKALKLDSKKTVMALSIAASIAPLPSGIKTFESASGVTMLKNSYGSAAMMGTLAALLAMNGCDGPADILEGETGFPAMMGADSFRTEELLNDLGRNYRIKEVGFKPYPCCRLINPAVDATLRAMQERTIDIEEIEEVKVTGLPRLQSYKDYNPRTILDAQFSLPYAVAVAIHGVAPGLAWYSPTVFQDKSIRKLAAKVKIVPDYSPDIVFHKPRCEVEIQAKGGTKMVGRVRLPHGEPEDPLSESEFTTKFRALCADLPDVGDPISEISRLETFPDIRSLVSRFALKGKIETLTIG